MAITSDQRTVIMKTIAREWLYLLGFVAAGLIVLPLPVVLIFTPGHEVSEFYKALFDRREWWIAWLIVGAPYIIFQLVRSVRWAMRASRE
jgi:hypothetical protein